MKKLFISFLVLSNIIFGQFNYEDYFTQKTLRLDFYHTGDAKNETISFERLIEEDDWGGSKTNLVDKFNYGYYFFNVIDSIENKIIYSRGFSTLYQEWQTTEEARTTIRSFGGSVTFPFPKRKTRIEIFRKDRKNNPALKFEYTIDPESYFIIKEKIQPRENFKVHYSGDPNKHLDIVFIPEGYSKAEMEKFKSDCKRFTDYLFDYSPFKENKNKINIWGVLAPSEESGTDIPGNNIWKQTILNSRFYTFDSERYLMTSDYFEVKNLAANAPYDQIYILVNTDKYGGGAIYNFYNLTAADNKLSKQIFVHEFGHGFAGLADEYADDATYGDYYPLDVEPWEANITTLVNFESKWKNLVSSHTPIPTPSEDKYKNQIGVFEGGGYVNKGVYRSTYNSLMNSFTSNEFNQISKEAIQKLIDYYSE